MKELEVTPETTLLCCQSKTDPTLEKTGKTITITGGLSASELTPGILTPVPKDGAGSAITGSVEFFGSPGDYLTVPNTEDLRLADSDFTIELWATISKVDNSYTAFALFENSSALRSYQLEVRSNGAVRFEWWYNGSSANEVTTGTGAVTVNEWHHYAVSRNGSTLKLFINGIERNSADVGTNSFFDNTATPFIIGGMFQSGAHQQRWQGNISNLRIVKGTALYTDEFIPPTRELKKVSGTSLLCCQDEDSVTTEATGKVISPYGSLAGPDSSRANIGQNLVTNGTFDSDTSGWTVLNTGTFTASSGQATLSDSDGTGTSPVAYQEITTFVPGKMYVFQFDTVAAREAYGYVTTTAGSNDLGYSVSEAFPAYTGSLVLTRYIKFVATQSTMQINFSDGSGSDHDVTVDNVKVYQIDPGSAGSNFTPQVGDDRKVTFEGVTKINSDAYFYLPTGDTVTRDSRYGRALSGGGYQTGSSNTNAIEYFNITSQGNALVFGDLTETRRGVGACSSSTRGIFAGGGGSPNPAFTNTIEFVTIASTGDAVSFGDLDDGRRNIEGLSSQTRGVFSGGSKPAIDNVIQFITIASAGVDAQDFGDLQASEARVFLATAESTTRGLFAGGYGGPSPLNGVKTIGYITIASAGNAQSFGDLFTGAYSQGGTSSNTRGVFAGGADGPGAGDMHNVIEYVTIASLGNAQDFGDLTGANENIRGTSNKVRGVFAGGYQPSFTDTMQYITISSTGNAQDFGDLIIGISQQGVCSDSHGGLG
jgi:hypothetical protein